MSRNIPSIIASSHPHDRKTTSMARTILLALLLPILPTLAIPAQSINQPNSLINLFASTNLTAGTGVVCYDEPHQTVIATSCLKALFAPTELGAQQYLLSRPWSTHPTSPRPIRIPITLAGNNFCSFKVGTTPEGEQFDRSFSIIGASYYASLVFDQCIGPAMTEKKEPRGGRFWMEEGERGIFVELVGSSPGAEAIAELDGDGREGLEMAPDSVSVDAAFAEAVREADGVRGADGLVTSY